MEGGEQEERGEQGQLAELRDEGRLGLHTESPFIEEGCAGEGRGDRLPCVGSFFSVCVPCFVGGTLTLLPRQGGLYESASSAGSVRGPRPRLRVPGQAGARRLQTLHHKCPVRELHR
jgi:hypothetical protein